MAKQVVVAYANDFDALATGGYSHLRSKLGHSSIYLHSILAKRRFSLIWSTEIERIGQLRLDLGWSAPEQGIDRPQSQMRLLFSIFRAVWSNRAVFLRQLVRNIPHEVFGNRIRYWYYKDKFFRCGEATQIFEGCVIYFPELIQIGHGSSVGRYTELNAGPGGAPCLVIGDDTWIGPYCFFRTANHRFDNPEELFIKQGHAENRIILGNDIYVGAHCVFLAGTEVGDHCVIAAGSVVSGKIPSYSVVGGNPARVIRKRK